MSNLNKLTNLIEIVKYFVDEYKNATTNKARAQFKIDIRQNVRALENNIELMKMYELSFAYYKDYIGVNNDNN